MSGGWVRSCPPSPHMFRCPAKLMIAPFARRLATLPLALTCTILTHSGCKIRGTAMPEVDAGGREGGSQASGPAGIPAPPDVAAPPPDATVTPSGLAMKLLRSGTDKDRDRPGPNDTVRVDYTAWTADGKVFDSTVSMIRKGQKVEPATLPLGRIVPGWAEGMQLMALGEKRRFWIPEKLAYDGKGGGTGGMLVLDVDLLDITRGPKPPADVAAAPPDAEVTKDGLASEVTQKGTGAVHPRPSDGVRVNYSIWRTTDAKLIDESLNVARAVTALSPWWTEGIQRMVAGEKRTFWVPATRGFAEHPGDTVTPTTMAIELLEILSPPPAPSDVHGPPKDATVEQDGLATKVIERGTGTAHPTTEDVVTVNYTGWTTEGKMFESSYSRGKPALLSIDAIVPGWTEALRLMVEGEKRRMWIPEALAYNGRLRRPRGMVVFDVELLKIGGAPQPGGVRPAAP